LLQQGFERVANHRFLLEQLLAYLLELSAFHQDGFLRLPHVDGLLLAIAQEPLGIFAVTLTFAQVHLNEALNDEWIQYGYLPTVFVQVVGQGQVIGTGGFHHEPAVRAASLDQLLKAGVAVAHF
jgi:hypothetical protein